MFLENVTSLIAKKGITKNKMLVELGLNKSSFVNWGNGASPSTDTAVKIAAYFNVSIDYLLTGEEKEQPKPTPTENIKFALFNGTDGITDEMYEEVKQFAEMVKMREESKRK